MDEIYSEELRSTLKTRKELAEKIADWAEIEKLPPHWKKAVFAYINGEVIGLSGGASLAGLDKIGFMRLLRKLNVPMVR